LSTHYIQTDPLLQAKQFGLQKNKIPSTNKIPWFPNENDIICYWTTRVGTSYQTI